MKYFFAISAFVLLVLQSVMLIESVPDISSPDRATFTSALIVIFLNCIGIFFNVLTLRGFACGRFG